MRRHIVIGSCIYLVLASAASGQTSASFVTDHDWDLSGHSNTLRFGVQGSSRISTPAGDVTLSSSVFGNSDSNLRYWNIAATISQSLHETSRTETYTEFGLVFSRYPSATFDFGYSYAVLGLRFNKSDVGMSTVLLRLEDHQTSFDNQDHHLGAIEFQTNRSIGPFNVLGGISLNRDVYESGETDTHAMANGRFAYNLGGDSISLSASIDEMLQNIYLDGAHIKQKVDNLSVGLSYVWSVSDKMQVTPSYNWSEQIGETYSRISRSFGIRVTSTF